MNFIAEETIFQQVKTQAIQTHDKNLQQKIK